MPETHLEFEKPIVELRKKLQELQELSENNQLDLSNEINSLTERMNQTMKEIYSKLTPWQRVQLARHPERPYTLDYIDHLFTNFIELSGDRRFRDDKAIVGGFAKFQGQTGHGHRHPEGARHEIERLPQLRLAEPRGLPQGDAPDAAGRQGRCADHHADRHSREPSRAISSEERHIAEAIAVNLRDMFALRVPVISVIIGEGGSGGAIGIGVGNRVLIMENAYYSVITPEGCAAILWKDRKFAPQAADALQLTAEKLLELGIADAIIPEPFGGAQRDHEQAAKLLGEVLAKQLSELRKLSGSKLREQRYEKFRSMGRFIEGALPAPGEQESPEAAAPEGDAAKEAVE